MGKSILLVTEDPITGHLLRLVLERDGHDVYEAEYGSDAANHVRQVHPDILILDATRRNQDGYVVCCPYESVQSELLMQETLLGNKTQFSELRDVLSTNAGNFLPKPVLSQDLIKSVRLAVHRSAFSSFSRLRPA
jgi:DNA-binding response OmpR family regulator